MCGDDRCGRWQPHQSLPTEEELGCGALTRLELITRIPGHDTIAAAARILYDGRASALIQMLHKIETAAGFTIIDRYSRPLAPTTAVREFISERF